MKKLTIIAFVVAITAVFAVSATANEWSLYGSARVATFYEGTDLGKELVLIPGTGQFITEDARNAANQNKTSNTLWNLQSNSRIGATVTGDRLEGRFEFSVSSEGAGGNVGTRRLYGVWKFADGWGLKVGKDYTPITFFLSNQVYDNDNNLQFFGEAYGARRGQVAVEGKLGPGMLKVALIDQTTDDLGQPNSNVEAVIPKFEASYEWNLSDTMSIHGFGGFQTYDVKYAGLTPTSTDDFSVDSWMIGAGAELYFGPFFIKPQVSYYQNGAAAGWLTDRYAPISKQAFVDDVNAIFGTDVVLLGGNGSVDAKNLMAMLALGFKATESLGFEFGVGYVGYETDDVQNFKIKNTYMEYYLQAVLTLAPGVSLVPEVGYRDFGDLETNTPFFIAAPDADQGSLFYAGAKWQIDF